MKEIEYVFYLSAEMKERLRVSAQKEKDEIIGFVVQFEAFIHDKWSSIVRYDTSHGFTHKDTIHPDGSTEKQPFYFINLNLALTFAIYNGVRYLSVVRAVFGVEGLEEKLKNG